MPRMTDKEAKEYLRNDPPLGGYCADKEIIEQEARYYNWLFECDDYYAKQAQATDITYCGCPDINGPAPKPLGEAFPSFVGMWKCACRV